MGKTSANSGSKSDRKFGKKLDFYANSSSNTSKNDMLGDGIPYNLCLLKKSFAKLVVELDITFEFQKSLGSGLSKEVKDAVASLSAQKSISKNKNKQRSRQKKLKAYNLCALSDALPELKAPRQSALKGDFKLSCKSRRKLVVKEREWFLKNLNDPAFTVDPLSAIHQHLLSTQPVLEEEQPKKKVNKNGSKKKKEKKLKASVISHNMVMDM
ncbi:putative ribosome biogenesis protein slx9-like isoform X2 [Senna tora]|uniref:Putative ribosome biogenesis protein slx9-like isoform X2 n=1 Tax=Senna tora TaxID=362788 RepID=A0A834X3T9_9FABA|nr:putative ribosome biogenesis protein slx9-like isoform X2 [Senna tora]